MVDNFYVVVHTRIRRDILKEIRTFIGAKDRSDQRNLIQTETVQLISADQTKQIGG